MKTVILHNQVTAASTQDELDVLMQVQAVAAVLGRLGWQAIPLPLSINLGKTIRELTDIKPALVFNLVESIHGTGRFLYFAAALLDHLRIPYTGSATDALYITTNKLLSKEWLRLGKIATPRWRALDEKTLKSRIFAPPYIIKPVWEDASVGLDDASVITSRESFREHARKLSSNAPGDWFAEAYIPGREFNISILADRDTPRVLPVAEIEFVDYPEDKPRIVDYRAKWEVESFEYRHTVRRFDFPTRDGRLLATLREMTLRCWKVFGLRGYARVDYRVDRNGKPWVLEINANPCISPDSGFVAAAERAGLNFETVVRQIIDDVRGVDMITGH